MENRIFSTLCAIALAAPAYAGVAPSTAPSPLSPAPEQALGLNLDVGYDTVDVWRGVRFGDDWVSTGITFHKALNDALALQLDSRYGATADDSFQGFDASYQRLEVGAMAVVDLEAVELGLGYRWFHQMGDADDVLHDGHQVALTLAKSLGPVNVGLGSYYDFESEGWIFDASASAEIKLDDTLTLIPSAGIVYSIDHDYWDDFLPALDGFVAVNIRLALAIRLTDNASLVPYIAARLPIDALDEQGGEDLLYGGVKLSVSF